MNVFGPDSAEVSVYTFKEGLLSRVAHDLKLDVTRFQIEIDGEASKGSAGVGSISATADAGSLSVVCARRDGHDTPRTLSSRDKRKIEKYIVSDVLRPKRHQSIHFESKEIGAEHIAGSLTLCGETRPIRWTLLEEGDGFRAEAKIHQPDFGIKPFTAMFGALAIQADVIVEVRVRI